MQLKLGTIAPVGMQQAIQLSAVVPQHDALPADVPAGQLSLRGSASSQKAAAQGAAGPSITPDDAVVVTPYSRLPPVMLVVAQASYHVEWTKGQPYPVTIMFKGRPDGTPNNTPITTKGREALSYLQYIIDNYHNLPDRMIFMHDHDSNWHITVRLCPCNCKS